MGYLAQLRLILLHTVKLKNIQHSNRWCYILDLALDTL